MQHKQKLLNKENNWNELKNYKPNDVVSDDGKLWQNVSGINTKPGLLSNNDWTVIDDSIDYAKVDFVNNEIDKIKEFATQKITNIAQLRNTVGEYEGQIVSLLGYYEAGDKEPLNYKWTSTQGVDDGGSVITNDRGSWVSQFGNEYNIKDFGIVGDGSDERAKVVYALSLINGKTINLNGLEISIIGQIQLLNISNFSIKNGVFKSHKDSVTNTENRLFIFNKCNNFTIDNVTFDGNRQERVPAEKAIHNISLRSCYDFKFSFCKSINSPCDGVHTDTLTPLDISTHTRNGEFYMCFISNSFRNNVSITAGQNIKFNKCNITLANGTLPMAGIDLETNNFGGTSLINNIHILDCVIENNQGWQVMSTPHDFPKNVVIEGGQIKAMASELTASNKGGVLVSNSDTSIKNVKFYSFTANSGDGIRISSNEGAFANVSQCSFLDFEIDNVNFVINTSAGSNGITVKDSSFNNIGFSMNLRGRKNIITNNMFIKTNNIYTNLDINKQTEISGNIFKNIFASRAIFSEGNHIKVFNNNFIDFYPSITSIISFVQSQNANAEIDYNNFTLTTANTSVIAVRFDSSVGRSLTNNIVTNMSLNPYQIFNTTYSNAIIKNNKGASVNIDTPNEIRSFNTLPDISLFKQGALVFDNAANQLKVKKGTAWISVTLS